MTKFGKPLLLIALMATTWAAASTDSDAYEFTFSNPSVGQVSAKWTIEYFTAIGCEPCKKFESDSLHRLHFMIDSGDLRIIFRTLPAETIDTALMRKLFCAQEYENYLVARATVLKEDTEHERLQGLAAARHSACLDSSSYYDVAKHNLSAFKSLGLRGTPSFVLKREYGKDRIVDGDRNVVGLVEELIESFESGDSARAKNDPINKAGKPRMHNRYEYCEGSSQIKSQRDAYLDGPLIARFKSGSTFDCSIEGYSRQEESSLQRFESPQRFVF